MRTITIEGHNIDLDHPLFKAKTLKGLKEDISIFNHLSDEEKEKAYDQLWKELHPDEKKNKKQEVTE
jgi:hypothetical protein